MKKSPEGLNKNYSPKEIAKLEKSRTISDAELLKGGAEYKIDEEGRKSLELTKEKITEIRNTEDKEVVLAEVKKNGMALQFIFPELQADKEVVLVAVKQDGWALKYASPELQADKEVVLEAVKQYGRAIQFASPELQADKEVRKAAGLE